RGAVISSALLPKMTTRTSAGNKLVNLKAGQTLKEMSDDLSRYGDVKANRRDKIPASLSKIAVLDAEMSQIRIE
nr:hypothetical protein [Clostridiales bacterium]